MINANIGYSPATWRPTLLGSMGGWWRADNVTITSGRVSTWQDLSPAGINISQSTSGQRPIQVASIINGRSVVRFDQSNAQYLVNSSLSLSGEPNTWWMVCKSNVQLSGLLLAWDGASVANGFFGSAGPVLNMDGGNSLLSPTQDITGAFKTYVCVFNGASSSLRLNGSVIASGTTANTSITEIRVGGCVYFWDGDVGEIGFTKQALSGTGLIRLENYLRRRYATW